MIILIRPPRLAMAEHDGSWSSGWTDPGGGDLSLNISNFLKKQIY